MSSIMRRCLFGHGDAPALSEGFEPLFSRQDVAGNHLTDRRLSAQSICVTVKHVAKLGLNPKEFGTHNLRAGLATSCAARGANLFNIMAVTRHSDVNTLKGW
jgi:site-specific recombinase XerD